MRKPDWKVAVVGGSIAAIGLGGFAAAQGGGGEQDSELPDGIRIQRDASASLHSLSSVVEVRPSVIDSVSVASSGIASFDSVNSVSSDSLDSVPSVAPAPQLAPAPAPTSEVDSLSIDSASVASVASVDSVDSSD